MPSITREFREALEKSGKKYCHSCDEIYIPPDAEHDEHERQRETRWKEAGLDPTHDGHTVLSHSPD